MKLIYIANARIPTEKAHGIQIMKMCEAFTLQDIEVELVLPKRINKIKKDPFDYYGIRRDFEIKKLPCLDLIPLDKYLGNLSFWIESLSFNLSAFFYLLTLNFKNQTTDIIYTRDRLFLPFLPSPKKLFFETHTFPQNYFLYSPFLKRLRGIVVITQKLKELFVKRGMPENKILVAPDGVDVKMFDIQVTQLEARKKLNLPLDKKIVLYTGHLYKWKGANILVKAYKYLSEGIEIYFVGGTEKDIKNLKFKISNLKLKNIFIVGHRPYSEIPYWLKSADVLVLPNTAKEDISKYWTSPMKMFEYMAAQRPIVASDLPSLREVLNEESSFLFEPDNPENLALAVKRALQNPEISDKISNQAFQDVQEYTWQKRAEKILKFINQRNKI